MISYYLDSLAGAANAALEVPIDQLKLVFCLLLSFPIGLAYSRITSRLARLVVGLVIGLYFEMYLYGFDMLYLVTLTLTSYGLLKIVGRNCGWIVTIYSLCFLAIYHAYRMFADYGAWNLDMSVPLMMSVPKICSVAWSYQDGKEGAKNSEDQESRKLRKLPNLFEYTSYIFFYANVLIGPACEYNDFEDFVSVGKLYASAPFSFIPSLGRLLVAVGLLGLTAALVPYWPQEHLASPEFAEDPFLYKLLYIIMAIKLVTVRYQGAFYLANTNVIACGLAYNGQDANGNHRWDRIASVSIKHDTSSSIREKLEFWNISVQEWLKRNIYLRICSAEEAQKNPSKSMLATNIAMMASAFWHGFYPGYYIGFFHLFLFQQDSKFIFKARHKLFFWLPNGIIRDILANFVSTMTMFYCGTPFVLLLWKSALNFYTALYFIPSLLMLAIFFFFTITQYGQRAPKSKPSVPKPAAKTE